MKRRCFIVAFMSVVLGCQSSLNVPTKRPTTKPTTSPTSQPTTQPATTRFVFEPRLIGNTLIMNMELMGGWTWEREASRKFMFPFVFVCHGGTKKGVWYCFPDKGPPMPVEGVAILLHGLMPSRTIVLIVCNEDGLRIHVDNVYFSLRKVTVPPRPEWVGEGAVSILEFINE